MTEYRYDDWRVENAQRNYPFSDTALLTNGTLEIPKTLFIDASLYPIGGGPNQFISTITKGQGLVIFEISDSNGILCRAMYDEMSIPSSGEVPIYDLYSRPAGVLVGTEESLRAFSTIDDGEYAYIVEQTAFAATVVVPQPALGVRGILLPSGDVMAGDVWLVGEDGIVVREENGALRIDAVGDPFAEQKLCSDGDPSVVERQVPYCPIRSINGVLPDRHGNIVLGVGSNQSLTNLLRITPQSDAGEDLAAHAGNDQKFKTSIILVSVMGERRMSGA